MGKKKLPRAQDLVQAVTPDSLVLVEALELVLGAGIDGTIDSQDALITAYTLALLTNRELSDTPPVPAGD